MRLQDCLREDGIAIGSAATDREAVLREIATLAKQSPRLASTTHETVYRALSERERGGSTGLARGVAIPHCRIPDATGFAAGIITVPGGIDFDAHDGEKTEVFVFLIGPEDSRHGHIRLLSGIARAMSRETLKAQLLAADSPQEIRRLFLADTTEDMKEQDTQEVCLITVTIRREHLLTDVLQILYLYTSSITVFEASDGADFLRSLPLFSTLWSDERVNAHRIVSAVISRELTTGVIDKLSELRQDTESQPGLMVVIQDVAYCSGATVRT